MEILASIVNLASTTAHGVLAVGGALIHTTLTVVGTVVK